MNDGEFVGKVEAGDMKVKSGKRQSQERNTLADSGIRKAE